MSKAAVRYSSRRRKARGQRLLAFSLLGAGLLLLGVIALLALPRGAGSMLEE